MLTLILYVVVLVLLVIFGLISYARWNFGKLEKQGIPTIKPHHYLLGSALLSYEKPGGIVDIEHMKKYGSIFGIYNGREPQIVICDAEIIRLVTAQDADHFDGKRALDFGDPLFNEMVEFQPNEKWKILRSLITPPITNSVRIKSMTPAMRETITDFITDLKRKMRESGAEGGRNKLEKLSINEAIYGMLTDLLARSLYSIHIGQSDINNRFVQLVRIIMSNPGAEAPWLASYVYAFPFLQKLLPNTMINPGPLKEFCVIIKQLVDMRRKQNLEASSDSKGHPKDLLDSLIEWIDKLDTPEFKKNNITDITMWSLGITFFLGGQDQISLILGSMFYFISGNPQIEKRLQEEVDKVFLNSNGVLDHESLSDLTYLNACITEATRLHPFFFRTERVCTKDWKHSERGIEIKKGDVVIIGLWAANRNPDYFEDPEEFKPERFMPGNKEKLHPYAFTSYGFGPRNCVGKRFAVEIMLLLSAYLIKEFRFVRRSDSKIQPLPAGPFFAAHEPIYFDVELRGAKASHEE